MPFLQVIRDHFVISTDPGRLDLDAIHGVLTTSPAAFGISRELVARAISSSLCFGLYDGTRQVGFARVVTDYATFGYLCDLYVAESVRGRGLGSWLIEVVRSHPELRPLRRLLLETREAHAFYQRHSFSSLATPERFMEVFQSDAYTASRFAPPAFAEPTLSPPSVSLLEEASEPARAEPLPDQLRRAQPVNDDGPELEVTGSEPNEVASPSVRVRPLAAEEGHLLRRLRLGALHDSPHTFGERLEDALSRPAGEWLEQARALAEPNGPRLFIAEVDAEAAGLVLVVEDPFDAEISRVGGMWVSPDQRRRGAGHSMLKAVWYWAEEHHKRRLRLWVQEDAAAARALYESFGFSYTGARKPFPREPARLLLEMDLTLRGPRSG
jgi:GNAT superfamily N-acetyltransferase